MYNKVSYQVVQLSWLFWIFTVPICPEDTCFLGVTFCCLFTGRMHDPEILPSFYKTLSLKLYNVLEDVGTSVEMRNIWKEHSICYEMLYTILVQPDFSGYCLCSTAEGTTTLSMMPDIDQVMTDSNRPIITNSHDTSSGESLLLVSDVPTPAGYCKLQLVHGRNPLFGCGNLPVDAPFQTKQNISLCIDKMHRVVYSFL